MRYVHVIVADSSYHGEEALTYSCDAHITTGTIVRVPLRKQQVLGIVIAETSKPTFATKSITTLPELPALPSESVQLLRWLYRYYPSPLGAAARLFLPKSIPAKRTTATKNGPADVNTNSAKPENATLPPVTSEQKSVLDAIKLPGTYVLHGETGTGKTRVYIELAKRSISAGASAIILTPEIGLTSQLADSFKHVFGTSVVVMHSQLSDSVRRKLWLELLNATTPRIIIGPRSALFCPLRRIGLVVVDESHETAYKQDQAPHYHASRVAAKLAELHQAVTILGSATPPIGDYYMAQAKKRPILRMQQAATGNTQHTRRISIIDLRDRSQFTRKPFLSDALLDGISQSLQRNEQVLLFLNRRGTARVIFCERCGWQASCPNCDLPLVYHGDSHSMRCHTCDYKATSPSSCPDCHSPSVLFKSIGTKAIVDDIEHFFPAARIMRFDTDNKKTERLEQHYSAIKDGNIDIIIGTQTLAKGLDLPRLGLVGIILADTGLYFPDFSAQERTYQLLRQVIGRIGRGHRDSQAILQTYSPESPLLSWVLSGDWEAFYKAEVSQRKQYLFPPYCYLLKLTCRRATEQSAQATSTKLVQSLTAQHKPVIIEGPAPAFHEKVQGKYQWQIIVKAKDRRELLAIIASLPSGWIYDIDPTDLL